MRNEPWSFGVENGKIESFLKYRNLKLICNLNSEDIEKEFFSDDAGKMIVKVNGVRGIAYGRKYNSFLFMETNRPLLSTLNYMILIN